MADPSIVTMPAPDTLLEVVGLSKTFGGRRGRAPGIRAVADVDFTLRRGETLGLVGESGCGKSTLSRLVLSLLDPDAGQVRIAGIGFTHAPERQKRELRRRIQVVFQDASSSLNPRMTIGANIAEPMRLQGLGTAALRRTEARRFLGLVGLRPEHEDRYPHEFSGGQCQRIAIARALMLQPEILVFDEAVSALDVSIRAQILRLMLDEPTQGVDVGARRDIYAALRATAAAGRSVLVTSSEPEELVQIAHRVIVLSGGRIAATLSAAEIEESRLLSLAHQAEHQGHAA